MTLWHRLDLVARNLSPLVLTLMLVILGMLPVHVEGIGVVLPALSLMAVYYWSIFRPDLMPVAAVFAVGLFQDILSGIPLGVHALVFVLVRTAVMSKRRFFLGHSFVTIWWGFALLGAGALALTWEIVSLLNGTLFNPSAVAFQYLLTLALFPCFAWIFTQVQKVLVRPV